ncbi:MAG: hypothetical protein EBS06_09215 [Proteobacteria bacterium]|nr:hypothetical protein [Pseudomonadota bacterium]
MTNSNDQNLDKANTFVDVLQDLWGSTKLSKITPKPVSETIDTVNTIIDIQQDVNKSSGISTWKIAAANITGGIASAPVFFVGESLTTSTAIAALVAGGFPGVVGSCAIFYGGTITTIEIGNKVNDVTRDSIISTLTSPGYMKAEDAVVSKVDNFVKSTTDILSKTTGWSQQPIWLNSLLKTAKWTSLQVENLESILKDSLNSLLSDTQTISSSIQSYLNSFSFAESSSARRVDPLTLDLDGDGVELVNVSNSTAFFDLDVTANTDANGNFDGTYTSDGVKEQVGWIQSDDGLLTLDKNGNGTVDNILEPVFKLITQQPNK